MTPTSSNSSTAHLPPRSGPSLLQERLRERKGESARQSQTRSVDMGERNVQSSPVKGSREERRPTSGGTAGKGMGVKQMEEVRVP